MTATGRILRDQVEGGRVALAIVQRFRGDLAPHYRALGAALLVSLVYTGARLLEPWPLKFVFDNVLIGLPLDLGALPFLDDLLAGDRGRILIASIVAIVGLAILRGVAYYEQSTRTARVGQEVVMAIRRRLFAHLQRLSLSFHRKQSTGDLLTRLTGDIVMLRELLVASLLSATSETIMLVGFLVMMVALDARLSVIALVAMPVVFALLTVYSGRIRDATRKQRRREGELAGRLQQVLGGIHVVQIFSREHEEDQRLHELNKRSLKSGLKATRLEAQLNRTIELAIAVATGLILWFGAQSVIDGSMTPGDLIVFIAYSQGFYRPLRRISRVTERASKASSCLERVTDILDRQPDVSDGRREAPFFRGAIRFEGVSYAYEAGREVLHGIGLDLEHGRTLAVVGPTGAGKSTLLGLVPRLYDPTGGRVLIDGHDIRDFTLRSLRDQVTVVPQDGIVFSGDFVENIAFGRPESTMAEIETAARAAAIHDFIASLPEGYATSIGERGVTLSGGQRQRLGIARALVVQAPIVLLDEPATGLDAEAEALVLAALDRLLTGRTAIVVAHRFATVLRADRIAFLEGGRIVELGTHDELVSRGGRYAAMWRRQTAAQPKVRRAGARSAA